MRSQNVIGTVQDTLKTPLPNANIIAKPKQEKSKFRFAIADHLGRFKLELEKETDYEIKVSYLGYDEQIINFDHKNPIASLDFILTSKIEQLKEIVINHKYEPITIKKDTVSYRMDAFTSGNERKLGEQLEKLPGVEVDKDGGVMFQGKRVITLLVDNKPFFGGGTKLGVQNIPADAVDKAEFIDHFNEVGFLKEVSDSNDLALNIKLKKDKKKFVFGDLQAGYGLDDNYLGHLALFYYSPRLNLAYIGDVNNFGQRVFTFDDLIRFQGGYSSFLSNRKRFGNLWSLSNDNVNMLRNRSLFQAANINYSASKKLDINGYFLYSKALVTTFHTQNLTYFQTQVEEKRAESGERTNQLFSSNIKLDYNPQKNTKWYYNIYTELANHSAKNLLQTVTNSQNTTFDNLRDADIYSIRQYIERHQKHNKKHTTTFIVNHSYDDNKPFQKWITDQPFLIGLIPIEEDVSYKIEKLKRTTQNSLDFLFKHYWTLNMNHHLYTVVGNQWTNSRLITDEKQLLTNGQINSFSTGDFGNDINYRLNDFYMGLEYKFRIQKWVNKPILFIHFYDLQTIQSNQKQALNRVFFEPQWESDYEFNDSEKLSFRYMLKNEFPTQDLLINNFTLQNFNSVFKGNALLNNERFHRFFLNYHKNNLFRGWMIYTNAILTNKIRNIRNSVVFDGINQFSTPIMFEAPETNWMINSSVSKRIYNFNVSLNAALNGFSYLQELDNITSRNNQSAQRIGLNIRTQNAKWPSVKVGYNHGFNQLRGVQTNDFQSQNFDFSFDYEVFNNVVFKVYYDWNRNLFSNRYDTFDRLDFSFEYRRKNNPWLFEVKVNNALNVKSRFNNDFNDFYVLSQEVFILPRVALLAASYKL